MSDATSGGDTSDPTSGPGSSSGTGSGGETPHEACLAWFDAWYMAYTHLCECDVMDRLYDSVEACLDEAIGPADCICGIFTDAPETLEQLHCFAAAETALNSCLEKAGMCPEGQALQNCIDLEASGFFGCGTIPAKQCDGIFSSCGSPGPFGECAPG